MSIKNKAVAKVFFIYVQMDSIEEPPLTFFQDDCFLYYIFHNKKTKENQSNWDDNCEETCKLEWQFEDTAKLNWEPMEKFKNRRCPCVFVTVCDNPSKCVLNTLKFAHVELNRLLKRELK